jgi:hypothetical protein
MLGLGTALSTQAPVAAQQTVQLVLNHLVLTLDSATWLDVANSPFMRDGFSAIESGFLTGPDGGTGMRLFGKYNFLKLAPPRSGQVGDIGVVLSVETPGALDRIKLQGPYRENGGMIMISADGPAPANGYFESSERIRPAGPDSMSDRTEFYIMQYRADAARYLSQADSVSPTNLSNARFLRRNFDRTKLLSQLTGATVAIPVADIAKIARVLERDSVTVLHEGEAVIVKLDGFMLHLIPPWTGAGVKQLQFALTREAVANPVYRFGPHSQLRFGPGPIAVWDFNQR